VSNSFFALCSLLFARLQYEFNLCDNVIPFCLRTTDNGAGVFMAATVCSAGSNSKREIPQKNPI
jgi:hypothetical protein